MKNHERLSSPYLVGTCNNGSVDLADLHIGAANTSGSVVCIKTNGGTLVILQAPNVTAGGYTNGTENTEEPDDDL